MFGKSQRNSQRCLYIAGATFLKFLNANHEREMKMIEDEKEIFTNPLDNRMENGKSVADELLGVLNKLKGDK